MSIGERTPRSAANGNAHFAVAWTREIARTCEPCKQNAEIVGDDFRILHAGGFCPFHASHGQRRSDIIPDRDDTVCDAYHRSVVLQQRGGSATNHV
jgi:hypothetical protein